MTRQYADLSIIIRRSGADDDDRLRGESSRQHCVRVHIAVVYYRTLDNTAVPGLRSSILRKILISQIRQISLCVLPVPSKEDFIKYKFCVSLRF